MPRATRTPATRKRKKKFFKRAKGFRGGRSKLFRTVVETVERAMRYATRDRKQRKREFRRLWISRINAACKNNGFTYSRFIKGLSNANVKLDRKVMADLAVRNPEAFKKLVELAQKSLKP
ncbi:MAG: 50S ribosomal protein L20 [Omnitrophica bacterium GWA2_52_8]|nr:MAG: 50S ribosomal protein L20 [Omnitrophica bacterium GWA2_52_8]